MGLFEDLFGPDEEETKKAYGEGVRGRDKADLFDRFVHSLGDEVNEDVHWRGKKEQSSDAGWHDREEGKVDWIRIDPNSESYSQPNASFQSGFGELTKEEKSEWDKMTNRVIWFAIILLGPAILVPVLIYVVAIIYFLATRH